MEKKHFVVPAGSNAKKYFVTFVCALLAAVLVIAVFALVTNRNSDEWLSGDNGAARENMFPFVFTSGGALYVLGDDLNVNAVDDGVTNAVHDAEMDRVYYTRNGDLYEYRIEKNTRELLCGGVESFTLFKERRSVVFKGIDGGVYVYKYNENAAKKLCGILNEEATSDSGYTPGESHVAYLAEYNKENGTAKLFVSDLLGYNECIAEGVSVGGGIYIWQDDAVISYYKDGKLILSSLEGDIYRSMDNAYVVTSSVKNVAVEPCTNVGNYGGAKKICYVLSDIKEDGSSGVLNHVKVKRGKMTVETVAKTVNNIVEFSSDDGVIVYTVPEEGENTAVYLSRNGGEAKLLSLCEKGSELFFDTDGHHLFIKRTNKKLSFIDANDKKLREHLISEDAGTVYMYVDKPYTVFHNAEETMHSIILNNNVIESFSKGEARLYGTYDDEYLMCRSLEGGAFSLDYVKDGALTRISGNTARNIVFDGAIENVIYLSDGEMYIWQGENSVSLGEYPSGYEAVAVVAAEK